MSPTTKDHGMEDISLKPAPSTFADLIDQYTALIQYYNKVNSTSSIPLPGLIYAEACAKVARLLLTVHMNKGWNDKVLTLVVQGKIIHDSNKDGDDDKIKNNNDDKNDNDKSSKTNRISSTTTNTTPVSIPRYEIAEWVMKIWSVKLNDLPLLDQV